MGFAAPWLWLFAAGIAVPLWVHLARRPHDTGRAVASLMFLKRHDVQQTRARTLRDRRLLLLRVLLWLALVAALAQPYVNRMLSVSANTQAVVVVVDQSASMMAAGRRQEAIDAFDAFNATLGDLAEATTPVAMLGATATSRQLLDFTTERAALRNAFAAAVPQSVKGRLRPALQHAADLLSEAGFNNGRIVLISDLQQSAMPLQEGDLHLGNHTVEVRRIGETTPANLTLASVRWQADTSRVAIRVAQAAGSNRATGQLRVFVNGHPGLEQAVELEAGEVTTVHLPVTPAADRTVEVIARLDDADFGYDNVGGLIIGAQRAIRYRADFDGSVPKQLSAALASFRSPRFTPATAANSVAQKTDLLIVPGANAENLAPESSTLIAFGGAPGKSSEPGGRFVATTRPGGTPIGQFDANSLAPELMPLRAALGVVDVPGAQALNTRPEDRILMRWANGDVAAVLRTVGAVQGLTIGIAPGAGLDAIGRSQVFAPVLRTWLTLALTKNLNSPNYAPGELIVRAAPANEQDGGAVIIAPDGQQSRWAAGSPMFAPLVPGRYEVVPDGEGAAGVTWPFWVRHDISEANLASMQSADFMARITRASSSRSVASEDPPQPAETRIMWWRAALCLVLLLALFELWLATRAAALEEGVH